MSQTSIRPISIPQSPTRMSRARSRTTTQATATGAITSSSASHSSSLSPDKLHLKSSTKSSLRPSSLSSSSRAAAKSDASTAMPSLDINIRDFFADGDTSVLKFMDEASIIREQARALQHCHDATLARTLQISQETAVTEAEARIKSTGKAKERTSNMDERGKTPSSLPSGKGAGSAYMHHLYAYMRLLPQMSVSWDRLLSLFLLSTTSQKKATSGTNPLVSPCHRSSFFLNLRPR